MWGGGHAVPIIPFVGRRNIPLIERKGLRMGGKIVSKVMWMGRATIFLVGLSVILAVTVGLGTTALAAAPGDPFKLGKYNSVDKITKLIGSAPRAMLRIDNNGAGAALDLKVEDGSAPMTVDSDEKVANLNADTVDGLSSDDLRGQQGEKGDQGESVTNADVPADPNNANCPNGGTQFTVGEGDPTFACTGDTGPKGDKGDKGDTGDTGPSGVSGYEVVTASETMTADSGVTATEQVFVQCPVGKRVLGGGADTSSSSIYLVDSGPYQVSAQNDWRGWEGHFIKRGDSGAVNNVSLNVYATCGSVN